MRLEYLVVDDKKFLEQMDAGLAGWANPAERLHQALEKDEFTLFCQPIAALTGAERYPMAEILVRLREEERALLPPGEFLPVFEHYRLMPQLDRWVVRTAVKRLARGSRIPRFTVNLSGQIHGKARSARSEEHTAELQSPDHIVCRLLREKKD